MSSTEDPTIEQPPRESSNSPGVAADANEDGGRKRVGAYRLLEKVGTGGMGEVWRAEQSEPIRRTVALKIIKLGMDSRQIVARFEAERQALALMDHPNIARVLDAGTTERGQPFFVMEFVKGLPITDHCDRERLSIEDRLNLFIQLCHAVQHAHQKGVIHRDIKPTNILVEYVDGSASPKVIDFGVAKATVQRLTERTLFTEQGQLIGTPEYMSPEQAEMSAQDIDTRTDIYSLGVLLYQLLTGSMPFDPKALRTAGFAGIHRIIREEEPLRPSTKLSSVALTPECVTAARNRRTEVTSLTRELRGDLDWIVMKCLEKDRARRYQTANALASDIERHLSDEPVVAGPPSTAYRLSKFVRRNRGAVIAGSAIVLALVAGTAASTAGMVWALNERARAEQAAVDAKSAQQAEAEQRQLAITNKERAEREAATASKTTGLLVGMFSGTDDLGRLYLRQLPTAELVARGERLAAGEFADDPLQLATILSALGRAYEGLGEFSRAQRVFERCFAVREENLGQHDPLTLRSMNQLAGLYHCQRRYEEAEALWNRALELSRGVLGPEDQATLDLVNNLAESLRERDQYEAAEGFHRQALESRRRLLTDDHPATLTSMHNLGVLLLDQGRFKEAEPLLKEALASRRAVLGEDHRDTLASRNALGTILGWTGRIAEAETLYRDALERHRRVLGERDPDTLMSMINMGALLIKLGRHSEAEPLYLEALDGYRTVLGDDHPSTLATINNMGSLYKGMGDMAKAEQYYRIALEGRRRNLGPDHEATLTSMNNLGVLLKEQGMLAEAESLLAEAAGTAKRILGEDHWHAGVILQRYGEVLAALGRYDEAETAMIEASRILEAAFQPGHDRRVGVIKSLVALYEASGDDDSASTWRTKLTTAEVVAP